MSNISLYLSIVIVIGITLSYLIDDLVVISKGFGGLYKINALASNLGSSIFLFSRAIMALILPILGFLIDSGVSIKIMLIIVTGFTFLMSLLKIVMYYNINRLILFLSWVTKKVYGADKITVSNDNFLNLTYKREVNLQSILAMALFISGMTIPSLMAIFFFDNRAFFIQIGFVFNMIGTLLTVLFIERKIAMDAEKVAIGKIDQNSFITSISSVILSRAVGAFICTLVSVSVLMAIY